VTVQSVEGQGTTFTLTLPRTPEGTSLPTAPSSGP
jgi:signal transduction histidine kinase